MTIRVFISCRVVLKKKSTWDQTTGLARRQIVRRAEVIARGTGTVLYSTKQFPTKEEAEAKALEKVHKEGWVLS